MSGECETPRDCHRSAPNRSTVLLAKPKVRWTFDGDCRFSGRPNTFQ